MRCRAVAQNRIDTGHAAPGLWREHRNRRYPGIPAGHEGQEKRRPMRVDQQYAPGIDRLQARGDSTRPSVDVAISQRVLIGIDMIHEHMRQTVGLQLGALYKNVGKAWRLDNRHSIDRVNDVAVSVGKRPFYRGDGKASVCHCWRCANCAKRRSGLTATGWPTAPSMCRSSQ